MSELTSARILGDLEEILRDFHGREYSGAFGLETRFFADLGLASIDAVVLGEMLEGRYGQRLPFGDLMATLGSREDRDLKIGEFVEFLETHLAGPKGRG